MQFLATVWKTWETHFSLRTCCCQPSRGQLRSSPLLATRSACGACSSSRPAFISPPKTTKAVFQNRCLSILSNIFGMNFKSIFCSFDAKHGVCFASARSRCSFFTICNVLCCISYFFFFLFDANPRRPLLGMGGSSAGWTADQQADADASWCAGRSQLSQAFKLTRPFYYHWRDLEYTFFQTDFQNFCNNFFW